MIDSLLARSAAVALAELDVASAGPFLLSRPLVLGPLLGSALGSPFEGAALGGVYELLSLVRPPLGGSLSWNAAVACGVAVLLTRGESGPVPVAVAFWLGLGAGWLHSRAEERLRAARSAYGRAAERALSAGRKPPLGAFLLSSLAAQLAMTALLCYFATRLGTGLWDRMSGEGGLATGAAAFGAVHAYGALPFAALGSLLAFLWRRA